MNLHRAYYVDTAGKSHRIPPEDAFSPAKIPAAELVWLHIDGRDTPKVEWLAKTSGLSSTVFTALTATETRPRSHMMNKGAIINLRGLATSVTDENDRLASIRLWVEKARVISVSFRPIAGMGDVRNIMQTGRITDPGDLVVAIASALTRHLDPEVARLGDEMDDLEAHISSGAGNSVFKTRSKVTAVRSAAIDYRRFLQPQYQALERLSQSDASWMDESDKAHLREGADRAARMAEEMEAIRERSALLHEELTDLRAEQIDQRSLVVAVIALVFLPLSFVTGLFGMNVADIPLAETPYAFWWISGACALSGFLFWFFLKWRRWI